MTDTMQPTLERIARSRSSYQAPEKGQKVAREYGRFRPWFETMASKADIDGPLILAASDLDCYWRIANDTRGITCSYGDQRWSTPIAHMSMADLLKPERREQCHQRVIAAQAAVEDPIEWDALICMIKRDDGDMSEAGRYVGHSASYAKKAGPRLVKRGLTKLAVHWGYYK